MSEDGQQLAPVEIKSGETINADFFTGLQHWRQLAGKAAGASVLIYGGAQTQKRADATVLPRNQIGGMASSLGVPE